MVKNAVAKLDQVARVLVGDPPPDPEVVVPSARTVDSNGTAVEDLRDGQSPEHLGAGRDRRAEVAVTQLRRAHEERVAPRAVRGAEAELLEGRLTAIAARVTSVADPLSGMSAPFLFELEGLLATIPKPTKNGPH